MRLHTETARSGDHEVRHGGPAFAVRADGRHAGAVLAQAGFYRIRFTADPVELTFFRAGLDRWLVGLEWPDIDRQDAVLAVNEACDHSVRHARLGDPCEVEVVARLMVGSDDRRIIAVVRDDGQSPHRWGAGDLGLTVVRACMDRVKISRAASGTTMTMTSRPVPLLHTRF